MREVSEALFPESIDAKLSQDWIDDCMRWYGKVLTGKKAHWCPDWDDLPIDADSSEFECCTCEFIEEPK